ncbi:MAG TPA: hypothetical protein VF707_06910 [Ardenticatenaceae bacterium]|jgi:hypothetical protein
MAHKDQDDQTVAEGASRKGAAVPQGEKIEPGTARDLLDMPGTKTRPEAGSAEMPDTALPDERGRPTEWRPSDEAEEGSHPNLTSLPEGFKKPRPGAGQSKLNRE